MSNRFVLMAVGSNGTVTFWSGKSWAYLSYQFPLDDVTGIASMSSAEACKVRDEALQFNKLVRYHIIKVK